MLTEKFLTEMVSTVCKWSDAIKITQCKQRPPCRIDYGRGAYSFHIISLPKNKKQFGGSASFVWMLSFAVPEMSDPGDTINYTF